MDRCHPMTDRVGKNKKTILPLMFDSDEASELSVHEQHADDKNKSASIKDGYKLRLCAYTSSSNKHAHERVKRPMYMSH